VGGSVVVAPLNITSGEMAADESGESMEGEAPMATPES
jgi:hypothetical protein